MRRLKKYFRDRVARVAQRARCHPPLKGEGIRACGPLRAHHPDSIVKQPKLRRPDWQGAGALVSFPLPQKMRGSRAPTGAGAEAPHPMTVLADRSISGNSARDDRPLTGAGAPLGALLRRFPCSVGPRFQQRALGAAVSQLLAGDRCVPGRSPDAARVRAVRQHARGRRTGRRPGVSPGARRRRR
jgi:hypothetical protein